jgi:hypothetical protein
MKAHHAAALALVVWYLTVYVDPMGGCIGCTHPDPAGVWGVYPNASDCQRVQKKLTAMFVENKKHPKTEYQVYQGTRCDVSDDQKFNTKGLGLKLLSPSEKTAIIKTGIPD